MNESSSCQKLTYYANDKTRGSSGPWLFWAFRRERRSLILRKNQFKLERDGEYKIEISCITSSVLTFFPNVAELFSANWFKLTTDMEENEI